MYENLLRCGAKTNVSFRREIVCISKKLKCQKCSIIIERMPDFLNTSFNRLKNGYIMARETGYHSCKGGLRTYDQTYNIYIMK